MVEQWPLKPPVTGSIPVGDTMGYYTYMVTLIIEINYGMDADGND
jgi:hypothetical protein